MIPILSNGDGLTPEQRTLHAATRARIAEIDRELFAPAAYHSANILSRSAARLNAVHEKRFETLRREREELLSTLPKEGIASGQRIVLSGHLLGATCVRDSLPEYPPDDDYDRSDPHQRFANEMGWSND